MKKLVYILNNYSNSEGSHFFHILHLLEEMAAKGVLITLVIEKAKDIPVFNMPNITVICQKKQGIQRFFELFSILKNLNKQGFKKIFIRISQNAALPSIVVSKIYGGQVYYWQSGTTYEVNKEIPFSINKIKWYFKSQLPFNIVTKTVSHFVTGPESMVDYYSNTVGINRKKIVCLYNDIDLTRFKLLNNQEKLQLKNTLGVNTNKKIVLFVHKLSPVRKSLMYIPLAMQYVLERNNNVLFYVIGGGSELPALKQQIEKLNLQNNIIVLGEKPNALIHQYYQVADLFINPTYTEGFPRVLLEAMAAGLPFVTTDAGGIKDILGNNQVKYMVSKHEPQHFAIKLNELIENDEMLNLLSIENLEQVKKYSTPAVAQMYINKLF